MIEKAYISRHFLGRLVCGYAYAFPEKIGKEFEVETFFFSLGQDTAKNLLTADKLIEKEIRPGMYGTGIYSIGIKYRNSSKLLIVFQYCPALEELYFATTIFDPKGKFSVEKFMKQKNYKEKKNYLRRRISKELKIVEERPIWAVNVGISKVPDEKDLKWFHITPLRAEKFKEGFLEGLKEMYEYML